MTACGQPVNGFAQVLTHHALDLICIHHEFVERAKFEQQLGSCFGAYLLHTWYIVHGIADQNLIVQHEAGGHTKFFLDARQIAALAVHGVDDGDVFIDQLRQIFVAT